MDNLEFAKELNAFSFNMEKLDAMKELHITEETSIRIQYSKLYYALYHRLLHELPEIRNATTPNKHAQVLNILRSRSGESNVIENTSRLFYQLKVLREWADYDLISQAPNYNTRLIYQKTYTTINYIKIFNS